MNTIFWHYYEAFELDYSEDRFIGIIQMELDDEDNKIHCQIMLEDLINQDREKLIIGRITSDNDAFDGCKYYAKNLLLNKNYCLDCWEEYIEENN